MTGRLRPATTYAVIVGQVLAVRRQHADIDQAAMAAGVGLSQSTWSRIERGASALSIEQLAAAARVLGTTPGALLGHADKTADTCRRCGVLVARNIDFDHAGLVVVDVRAVAGLVGIAAKPSKKKD